MYKVTMEDNDGIIFQYFANTYAEARGIKAIMLKYPIDCGEISVVKVICTNPNELAKEFRQKRVENIKREIEQLKKYKRKEQLAELKAIKTFLDPYLATAKDYIPLIPKLHEAIKKTKFDITLYDGINEYYPDGTIKLGDRYGCRAEEIITIKTIYGWNEYLKNGKYHTIDEDIAFLQRVIPNEKAQLAKLEKELTELIERS